MRTPLLVRSGDKSGQRKDSLLISITINAKVVPNPKALQNIFRYAKK
jgi:hypothetical protein